MEDTGLLKVLTLTAFGFAVALVSTPFLTAFLKSHKMGKPIRNDGTTPIFSKLHANKEGTPTMGGVLVWGSTLALAVLFWFMAQVSEDGFFEKINFLTRRETLLPLGAFLGASLVGMADDWLDLKKMGYKGRGLRFRFKFWLYVLVASIGAWWFYFKLGFDSVYIPFWGDLSLGWVFIPFFIFTVVSTAVAVNQTDGLDGLAGGTLLLAFFSFGIIAYLQGRVNLASLIGVVCGSLLAFLWFNVYPAKFFMGDTGSMGLGVLLAIVAFLTNSILVLPLVGLIFLLEALSTILQLASKKFRGQKIFLSSPLHNHFLALDWPEAKVTMRFWIVATVSGILGMVIYFIS